ncbi:MAG: extracellular solute-binding protein, partial [Spirochaetales bacterium]|nr:extracellular solute-binding protein [Spirochaetales bacterium]
PVTLKLYHYHDLSDQTATGQWNEILAAWEEYSDIKLDIEYQNNEPFHNKLQAMAVSGQIPDMLYLWPLKRTGYVTGAGLIKDLRPYLKGHEDEFAQAALTQQGSNGEIYELPQQITATHVMFSNTKLMKELGLTYPKTMAELLAQGDKIKAAGLTPIAMDNGDGWEMQSCFLSALTERAGGMKWYDAVRTGEASFSDPEFVNALSVIADLSEADMFSPGINSASYGTALDDFVNGRAVYFIDGGWRVQSMVEEVPEDMKPYVELNTFPEIPNQKGQADSTAVVAGTGFGMNANLSGAKADAAWDWIYFYSGPVGAKIRVGHGMIPSAKVDMGDIDPLLAKLVDFLNTKPAGYVIDAVIDAEGMSILHPDLQEMMFGNMTAQTVADNFEKWVAANDSTRNPK